MRATQAASTQLATTVLWKKMTTETKLG